MVFFTNNAGYVSSIIKKTIHFKELNHSTKCVLFCTIFIIALQVQTEMQVQQ